AAFKHHEAFDDTSIAQASIDCAENSGETGAPIIDGETVYGRIVDEGEPPSVKRCRFCSTIPLREPREDFEEKIVPHTVAVPKIDGSPRGARPSLDFIPSRARSLLFARAIFRTRCGIGRTVVTVRSREEVRRYLFQHSRAVFCPLVLQRAEMQRAMERDGVGITPDIDGRQRLALEPFVLARHRVVEYMPLPASTGDSGKTATAGSRG